jgi:Calcineurin-like phosphoesterase
VQRVAVITDIHATCRPLEAVLEAIEWADVDAVFCGGDLVGYGPDPNEVCALIIKTLRTDRRVRLNQRHGILHFTIIRRAYDAGNFGMQRRRVHGVIAQPDFNPRALMEDEFVDFTKSMETIDTVPAHEVAAAGV